MIDHDVVKFELHRWTETALGQSLIWDEEQQLRQVLTKLYGPIAIQLGALGFCVFMQSSSAIHHIFSIDHRIPNNKPLPGTVLHADAEAMPLDAKSVSVLLLPHVLEFSHDPHKVLREAERVLVPEGHLVLVCFNPISCWGIRSVLSGLLDQSHTAPWCGRFYRLARVKDWVSVLGFEIISGSTAYYLPPLKSSKLRSKLSFLQKMGPRWWPMWSAIFILVARKKEFGMTPIVPRWRKKQRLAPGLVEPVTKNG